MSRAIHSSDSAQIFTHDFGVWLRTCLIWVFLFSLVSGCFWTIVSFLYAGFIVDEDILDFLSFQRHLILEFTGFGALFGLALVVTLSISGYQPHSSWNLRGVQLERPESFFAWESIEKIELTAWGYTFWRKNAAPLSHFSTKLLIAQATEFLNRLPRDVRPVIVTRGIWFHRFIQWQSQ